MATNDAQSILAAAEALAPRIREAAAQTEQGRRLPPQIVDGMKQAGIFRMAMPREWGGPELDPISQMRVMETLARADGSAGWCAMINVDGGWFAPFLDQKVAREMYRDLDAPTGSSLVFSGRAQPVAGGYRVNGRWPFVSGCQHCEWIVGTCVVEDASQTRSDDAAPELRIAFMHQSDGEIIDTWNTTGLRGTGSNDFAVNDLFVPAERTSSFPNVPKHRSEPLYAFAQLFLYKASGPVLGMARGAIDAFIELANTKHITMTQLARRKKLMRDEGYIQATAGQAEALVSSARAFVYETMNEIWGAALAGKLPTLRQRALGRLAMLHAHTACTQAVDLLYKAVGGSAVYTTGALNRCFRDIHTANQHTVNSLKIWEKAGSVILGSDSGDPLF